LPKDPTQQAASYARNGGLAFALGGLISAITYLFSNGPYLLAWAPLVAGLLGLAWWGGRYLRIPKRAWRPDHVLLLGGLVLFGVVSAGWVSLTGTRP
jgi:VIT1/CCC1 family predicted Fe2+/Mn2+ transporter